jgi:glycosyl transferase family 2
MPPLAGLPAIAIETLLPAARAGLWLLYTGVQLLLLAYSWHRCTIVWRMRRVPAPRRAIPARPPRDWPPVTVQLPIYNEPLVVERLIESVAALDYPADRLEIQVLDDSSDQTRALAARVVARLRERGVDIHHLWRNHRRGYKAGALAAGLERARGELLAVFDADFVPPPDFLRRIVPLLADPRIGMVQARWAHLNRGHSALTAGQAAMIDAHFLLEHRARARMGCFLNFNGSAGVWRRVCIEDAGGWSDDTLTEDLDLSFRAQLRGWRFRFEPSIEAPAELPIDIEALKSQQRRWAKGSIQTARKLLPRVLAARLPVRVKLEALAHLTAHLPHALLVAAVLMLLPLLAGPGAGRLEWTALAAVPLASAIPAVLFLAGGCRAAGRPAARTVWEVLAALVLGVGLSLNNARAVIEGAIGAPGGWERTPKSGDVDHAHGRAGRAPGQGFRWGGRAELALALYAIALTGWAWHAGDYLALPFLAMILAGFGSVGLASFRHPRARPARAVTGE